MPCVFLVAALLLTSLHGSACIHQLANGTISLACKGFGSQWILNLKAFRQHRIYVGRSLQQPRRSGTNLCSGPTGGCGSFQHPRSIDKSQSAVGLKAEEKMSIAIAP